MTAPPLVHTALGALAGRAEAGLHVFKGVPYAQPPVGALRWRPPQALQPWSGVREAGPTAPASLQMNASLAPQVAPRIQALDPGVQGILPWPGYVKDAYAIADVGEDCLYLSIWAPPTEPGEKLPVYLYYHGGANAVSSGSLEIEDGAKFARHNRVVVVKPNYRLGALGWVHFGLLDDCPAEMAEAVNLGLQDQLAALEWVHRHIGAFGGDSANITVGGESAGATAVSHFLTHPRARRCFRRAVVQSFTPFNNWCTSGRADSEWVAREYLRLLGCRSSQDLLQVPVQDLLAVQNIMTRYHRADTNAAWRPLGAVVDGVHVKDFPARALSQESLDAPGLELVLGFAKDEWQFFRGHAEIIERGTRSQVIDFLGQVFEAAPARLLAESFAALPHNQGKPWGQVLSDIMAFLYFKLPSYWIVQNLARQGIPVRVYQFSYDLPGEGGKYRALHTGNLPFLWLNMAPEQLARLSAFDGIDLPVAQAASQAMVERYGQFLRGQEPQGWDRFDEAGRSICWFGPELINRPGLLDEEMRIAQAVGLDGFDRLNGLLQQGLRRTRAS